MVFWFYGIMTVQLKSARSFDLNSHNAYFLKNKPTLIINQPVGGLCH